MNSTTTGKLTAGQCKAYEALPELKDSKFPQVMATMPAANYVDPSRFDAEHDKLFRRKPVIAALSAQLPTPGTYLQIEMLGMPVLLTRAKDEKVRAFVNVCRHRGAQLYAGTETKTGARIVCPYHAWTYQLDGSLFGIPRQEIFPGIDKSSISLTPLPAVEAGGFIWIGLDPEHAVDFTAVQGELEADLDVLGLRNMRVFDQTVYPIQANWKLVMDTMLDSYHVTRLHKDSLARFFVDAENIIDRIGPHVRVAAARGNFTRGLPCDTFEQVRQVMVFHYTLFPNGIVVVSPDFISVGILYPVASDRTDVHYSMMTSTPADDEKMQDKLRRSFDLMHRAFGQEDYWAAEQCDKGLRTGTMKDVILGGMEMQISMFHDTINRCLIDG